MKKAIRFGCSVEPDDQAVLRQGSDPLLAPKVVPRIATCRVGGGRIGQGRDRARQDHTRRRGALFPKGKQRNRSRSQPEPPGGTGRAVKTTTHVCLEGMRQIMKRFFVLICALFLFNTGQVRAEFDDCEASGYLNSFSWAPTALEMNCQILFSISFASAAGPRTIRALVDLNPHFPSNLTFSHL
jgi:hypothetical protein